MRRIGNRLQLAILRWKRDARRLELFRFRQRWAKKFGEYECVGGPFDGQICRPPLPYTPVRGCYELETSDCRLHYRAREVPTWSGQ